MVQNLKKLHQILPRRSLKKALREKEEALKEKEEALKEKEREVNTMKSTREEHGRLLQKLLRVSTKSKYLSMVIFMMMLYSFKTN